jgi:symplekin
MASKGEPNLSSCPSHHPFLKAQELEEEANKLLEESITALYTTKQESLTLLVFAIANNDCL